MTIKNFDATIKNFDGTEVLDAGKPIQLKSFIVNALTAEFTDERVTGDEKLRRFKLAEAVYKGGDIELKIEDMSLIKDLVGKAYSALIVGQVYQVLEG